MAATTTTVNDITKLKSGPGRLRILPGILGASDKFPHCQYPCGVYILRKNGAIFPCFPDPSADTMFSSSGETIRDPDNPNREIPKPGNSITAQSALRIGAVLLRDLTKEELDSGIYNPALDPVGPGLQENKQIGVDGLVLDRNLFDQNPEQAMKFFEEAIKGTASEKLWADMFAAKATLHAPGSGRPNYPVSDDGPDTDEDDEPDDDDNDPPPPATGDEAKAPATHSALAGTEPEAKAPADNPAQPAANKKKKPAKKASQFGEASKSK